LPGHLHAPHRSARHHIGIVAAFQRGVLHSVASGSEYSISSSALSSSNAEQQTLAGKQLDGQAHQQALQQKQVQQLQQHLQRCTNWRQLLPLAANVTTAADATWLAAVALKAAQLRPSPTPQANDTAAAIAASASATLNCPADVDAGVAAASVAAAAAALAGQSVDQQRRELLLHRTFMQHLLALLGAQLSAAAAVQSQVQAPPVPSVSPALLCQLLTQLAVVRMPLPDNWPQQHLLPYLAAQYSSMQLEELLAVLVGLAALHPAGLHNAPEPLQQQLLQGCLSGQQQQQDAAVQHVVHALWAAARLRWSPGQDWVQQAARLVLQQVKACSASELAMALFCLASLRCDMQQLQSNSQQSQQQQLQGSAGSTAGGSNGSSSSSSSDERQQEASSGRHGLGLGVQQQQQQQWGGRSLLRRPVAAAPQQLLQAVFDAAAAFTPHELCGVLWATAELPLLPQQPVVRALLAYCLQPTVLQQYNGADLTRILWFLARMQHQSDLDEQQQQQQQHGQLLSEQQQQEQRRQWLHKQRQRRQQVNASTSSRGKRSSGDALVTLQVVQPLLDALLLQLPVLPSHGLGACLRSIAVLGVQPPGQWVARVLQHCQLQLPEMRAASLVLLAAAVADLGYLPNGDWLRSFYTVSQPVLAPVQTHDSGSSSSSTSGRLSQHQLQVLVGAVAKISRLRSQPFEGQKPPASWLNAVAGASAAALAAAHAAGTLTAGQLSFWGRIMHRFACLAGEPWEGPGRQWWLQFVAYGQPLLQAATPNQLCNIAEVLTHKRQQRQLGQLPEAWLQSFLTASRALLPSSASGSSGSSSSRNSNSNVPATRSEPGAASAADLVLIGKALAKLGVLPSREWRQAWMLAVERRDASMTAKMGNSFTWTVATFCRMEAQQQQQQQGGVTGELGSGKLSAGDAAGYPAADVSGSNSSSLSSGSDWAELADAFTAASAATEKPPSEVRQQQQQQQQQLLELLRGSSQLSATYDDSGSGDEAVELSPLPLTSPSDDAKADLSMWEEQFDDAGEAAEPGSGWVLGNSSSSNDGAAAAPVVEGGMLAQQLHDNFWRQLDSMDDMQQQLDISLRRQQQPTL
jgi:hypothetical protein